MCLTLEYCNGFDTLFNLFHVRIVLTSFKSHFKLVPNFDFNSVLIMS